MTIASPSSMTNSVVCSIGLQGQGLLENTDVIITSDHGEGFGDHGIMGHAYTATLEEIGVPLVILSPAAPAGRVVDSPVSLRDLPATVVDLLGLSAASPFPGRSLAAYWKLAPGEAAAGRDQPCLLGAGERDRVPNSARARPQTPWVPDVPGGLGPSLHPRRHGGRAALRSEDRPVRAGEPLGAPPPATTRWPSSERCSSTC